MGARTAVVVGGGIGGLTSAIALRRAGWEVQVLERSDELREVGAGISLWPNALQALDLLGVGDRVRALPTIAETPPDFPAVVLYDFRVTSLGGHFVLWAVLALVFAELVHRGMNPAGRARAARSDVGRPI